MSKKYEEPTKLQLELMINKGMGIKEIQKKTHKQFAEIKQLIEQYGLSVEDKRKKYMESNRITITPTKVPEKRDMSEIHNRYATKQIEKKEREIMDIENENEQLKQKPVGKIFVDCVMNGTTVEEEKSKEIKEQKHKTLLSGTDVSIETITNYGIEELQSQIKTLKTSNEALMKENEEYQAKIKELKFQLEVVSKNRAYENSGREIKTDDPVSHPNHYCQGGHECIDEMLIVFGVEAVKQFCLLNVWKYRKRALLKNGQQDMDKADWYMNKYFELSEQE